MLCHRARREGKALANFTQKAIRASFIKLLNQKPLSQITIKDIVDDCGVNRNTFYYYFQDLPDLVETITKEEAQRVIQLYPAIDSIEQCLDALIDFALENRKAVSVAGLPICGGGLLRRGAQGTAYYRTGPPAVD